MGSDTLISRTDGNTVEQDYFNLFNRVLQGALLGRNSSGAITAGQDLGSQTIPWGTARITELVLNGASIDTNLLTSTPNRMVSGKTKTTSAFPDFMRPAGSGNGANLDILGATTTLKIDVAGAEYEIITDINKAGLTVGPSSNNTCLINDTGLTGQQSTKNLGEDGTIIIVDNMGSELTGKVGEFVALKNQSSGEIFYCLIQSTGILSHAQRGFFLDENGAAINRAVLNNNEILQILTLGFVFLDKNTTTVDVSYTNPTISETTPGSPGTGDYWLDTVAGVWKRYDGGSFVIIDRTFSGYIVLDPIDAVGARCTYFGKRRSEYNSLVVALKDINTVETENEKFAVSVNGELLLFDFNITEWAASTDFESGVSRTANRTYYLYITEEADVKISDQKPYDTRGSLKGLYHPWETWRSVGEIFNNGSNEFTLINTTDTPLVQTFDTINEVTPDAGVTVEGVLLKDSDVNSSTISGAVVASAADIRTGTATTKVVTPEALSESDVSAKAWVNFNGTGTVAIRDSYNVSSITDNGTGDYTVNFTTSMADADYIKVVTANHNYGQGQGSIMTDTQPAGLSELAPTASGFRILARQASDAVYDAKYVSAIVFGDQ